MKKTTFVKSRGKEVRAAAKDRHSKTFRGWIGSKESAEALLVQYVDESIICDEQDYTDYRIGSSFGRELGKPRRVKVKVTVEIEDVK